MSTYSIGIDLGTTNSAVSYFKLSEAAARGNAQTMLAIPQITAVGVVEEKLLLPSFFYLPNDQEFPAGSLALPWDKKRKDAVVGEFARSTAAKFRCGWLLPQKAGSVTRGWIG
jgi:molecular chaperone DnaK (HSP70)